MIDLKYKKLYNQFIEHYKMVHVNPWHNIDEKQLNEISFKLLEKYDVYNESTFCYFMNYIIKRLSGKSDAHTLYKPLSLLPINFKIFNNDILVNFPESLKGSKLIAINDIDINKIIGELEEIITYDTFGRRKVALEEALFNRYFLCGLPLLKKCNKICYKLLDKNNKIITKTFDRTENYFNEMFNYMEYQYGLKNATFEINNNCLIYYYSSCNNRFKDQICNSVKALYQLDLTNIDTIIVDLRGNHGGNSALNEPLMNFLKQASKNLICLTDYRVFSAGRYALINLINLGATTIGEEIATSINCYGECSWLNIDNHLFSSSSCYFHPLLNISISSKEKFKEMITSKILEPVYFEPDIKVFTNEEDYLNNQDTILNSAFKYIEQNRNMRK